MRGAEFGTLQIAALGGHNATAQTRIQPCKGPRLRHEHSHASIAGTGPDSSRQTPQQPPEPQPQHRLPSESGGECASVQCVRCRTCSILFKVMFARAESLLTPGNGSPDVPDGVIQLWSGRGGKYTSPAPELTNSIRHNNFLDPTPQKWRGTTVMMHFCEICAIQVILLTISNACLHLSIYLCLSCQSVN